MLVFALDSGWTGAAVIMLDAGTLDFTTCCVSLPLRYHIASANEGLGGEYRIGALVALLVYTVVLNVPQ